MTAPSGTSVTANYWAVLPAAGTGRRMASETPKQYLALHGRSVLEWSLTPFLSDARCRAVMVVLAADDEHWLRLSLRHPKLQVTQGGAERADSVLAGLNALLARGAAQADDWVLVHDAARPCLDMSDLDALLAAAAEETAGALLATPVADTLKRATAGERVDHTVSRRQLWRAQTPQMFKLGLLQRALLAGARQGLNITDESSAIEALGLQPRLIAGRSDNIKITLPEDLLLAARVLAARG